MVLDFIYDNAGPPVAVPEKIFGLTLILDFFDRCHSLASLYLPPAAVGSLLLCSAVLYRRRQHLYHLLLYSELPGIGIAPIETIDINGDGTIDCYVYEYSYSGYAPLGMGTSATIPVSGSGKIYIFDGVSEDYITNPQNHPEGFNSDTDFMAIYYIDRTEDGRRNYIIQIADSCKCRIEVQMRAVAKELRSFGAQYKRSWKRTEDSIVTEWKEHNRYAFLSDSAKHTDFDTEEEGKGFFYFAWKAFKRAVF